MIETAASPHLIRDGSGQVWIDDTNVKVIELALDHLAYGWSAEEIHRQHPRLSLAQIHASLAYYYDHQDEFDASIAESLRRAESLADRSLDSPGRRRLRAMGKLR